jgi:putative ABC transport system ATP-binding protein
VSDGGVGIRITGLTKRYPGAGGTVVVAVDGIDLSVDAGEIVAVTGASGSGKSTLLHLVAGLERADGGTIVVGDTTVTALSERGLPTYRRSVGQVFQRFHLLPALSALDNVLVPLIPQRTGFDKVARAREVLGQVGLAGRESARPGELSGGQQQRVGIARALVNHPGLLLADEPTGSLDSNTGDEIVDLLLRLRESTGMTVLVATHSAQVAAACDRLVRLRDGAVVGDGRIEAPATAQDTLRRIEGLSL